MRIAGIAIVVGALLAAGCGGGGGAPLGQTVGSVRVIHAGERVENVDLFVDGALIGSDLAFMDRTAYTSVLPGRRTLTVASHARRGTLATYRFDISKGRRISVVLSGTTASPVLVAGEDGDGPPGAFANLKVLNALTDVESIDVFVVPAGQNPGSRPQFDDVASASATRYATLGTGAYDVTITTGRDGLVLHRQSGVQLGSGQALTMVVLARASGSTSSVAIDLVRDNP